MHRQTMHRQQQTQELAEVVSLSHKGERFATPVGVDTDLATAGNGVARARRTVVHFSFFIQVTNITPGAAGCPIQLPLP
jgi:hypothetical protein